MIFLSIIRLFQVSTLLVLASTTPTGLIERRGVIPHDAVQPFPENVGTSDSGKIYLKYKPFLKVVDGCVPFPAVQADGSVR